MGTQTEKQCFSPYFLARKLGAIDFSSGINWTYATFETKQVCEDFAEQCGNNGYRTRNQHNKPQDIGADLWSVQYHHYQD